MLARLLPDDGGEEAAKSIDDRMMPPLYRCCIYRKYFMRRGRNGRPQFPHLAPLPRLLWYVQRLWRNKEQNAFGGQQNDSGAPGCEKEGMVPKAVVILLPCSLGREGDARYSYVGQHPSLHIGRCACGNVYIFVLEFFSCT